MYNWKQKEKLSLKSFESDMKHFVSCYNFLFKQGFLNKKYNKHLDIGGAHGHFSFILNFMNIVNESVTLDKRKFTDKGLLNHFKIYYHFLFKRKLLKLFYGKTLLGKFGYTDINSIYFNLPIFPKKLPRINYSEKNFYNVKNKYDLITSVSSLEFFESKRVFQKISSLLVKKGIFFMMLDYWWYPYNSSGIVLEEIFQLHDKNFKSLKNFIKNKKKYDLKEIKKKYFYYHNTDIKPTIDDYIDLAYKNNLKLQSIERFIPSERIESRSKNRTTVHSLKNKKLDQIMKDISKVKKNIKKEDLFTQFIYLIFEKK